MNNKFKCFKNSLLKASALVLIAATTNTVLAQGTVSGALTGAATEVKSSFIPITNIMYAVCAIMGIVGAIQVYSKWSAGDPDTRKSAASWFGALIFAGLVVVVIQAVFGA